MQSGEVIRISEQKILLNYLPNAPRIRYRVDNMGKMKKVILKTNFHMGGSIWLFYDGHYQKARIPVSTDGNTCFYVYARGDVELLSRGGSIIIKREW